MPTNESRSFGIIQRPLCFIHSGSFKQWDFVKENKGVQNFINSQELSLNCLCQQLQQFMYWKNLERLSLHHLSIFLSLKNFGLSTLIMISQTPSPAPAPLCIFLYFQFFYSHRPPSSQVFFFASWLLLAYCLIIHSDLLYVSPLLLLPSCGKFPSIFSAQNVPSSWQVVTFISKFKLCREKLIFSIILVWVEISLPILFSGCWPRWLCTEQGHLAVSLN